MERQPTSLTERDRTDRLDAAASRYGSSTVILKNFMVGRAVLGEPRPYRTSTTTLKNRIAAFSAAVAPSTDFHSPSSVAAPFITARAPGTFHCDLGGSTAMFAKCGVRSAFIGKEMILKSFVAISGSSPTT